MADQENEKIYGALKAIHEVVGEIRDESKEQSASLRQIAESLMKLERKLDA